MPYSVVQGDKWKSKARITVEPKLKGDVQDLAAHIAGWYGQGGDVAHHVGVAKHLALALGQLIPNVQPVAVVFIDPLATDLNLDGLDQLVTDPWKPAEGVAHTSVDIREADTEVHTVNQIAIAADSASDLAAPRSLAVESLLNGLHGKVGVTPIDDLEESDLGVTSKVNILRVGISSSWISQIVRVHLKDCCCPESRLLVGHLIKICCGLSNSMKFYHCGLMDSKDVPAI
jgi:hypothetical protein